VSGARDLYETIAARDDFPAAEEFPGGINIFDWIESQITGGDLELNVVNARYWDIESRRWRPVLVVEPEVDQEHTPVGEVINVARPSATVATVVQVQGGLISYEAPHAEIHPLLRQCALFTQAVRDTLQMGIPIEAMADDPRANLDVRHLATLSKRAADLVLDAPALAPVVPLERWLSSGAHDMGM
jgi:hypothetical protein